MVRGAASPLGIAVAPTTRTSRPPHSLSAADLLAHIKVLASDEFEGRAPGTAGEERTVAYLTEQFRGFGLKPGNPDGTFVQDVPLVGFQATVGNAARSRRPGRRRSTCRS